MVKIAKVKLSLLLIEKVVLDAPKNYSVVYLFDLESKIFSLLPTKDEEVSEPEVEKKVVASAVKIKKPKTKGEIVASEVESFYSSGSKSEEEERIAKGDG